MRRILRSLVWAEQSEKDGVAENFGVVARDRLVAMRPEEVEVLNAILTFFESHGEAPQFSLIQAQFVSANLGGTMDLLADMETEKPFFGGSFRDYFEEKVELQAVDKLHEVLTETLSIATNGSVVSGTAVKGVDAAIGFLFSEAKGKPEDESRITPANPRDNPDFLDEVYKERKTNPTQSYGIPTGYGIFDSATAGIKRKQLYFHAGFGGHLKTTHMLNMIVNSSVDGGWNTLLFTSEMPATDVQFLLVAIHSGNAKYAGSGVTLSSFQLLLGGLNDQQEAFFKEVKKDLFENQDHGTIRVIDSARFTTFGSIKQITIREHVLQEVDVLWVDYITRLPLDVQYKGMDQTTGKNETIADAKRFAMGFDGGRGLAVCSPFQVNREGFKYGKANEGRLNLTFLAQYNAAEREADVITYIFYDTEEQAASEPKIGVMKSRWGARAIDPASVFIDADTRRIMDLSSGVSRPMSPTSTTTSAEDEVEL